MKTRQAKNRGALMVWPVGLVDGEIWLKIFQSMVEDVHWWVVDATIC